jgi:hypothetical protein
MGMANPHRHRQGNQSLTDEEYQRAWDLHAIEDPTCTCLDALADHHRDCDVVEVWEHVVRKVIKEREEQP